ncbi:M20/M25/M40 family metallo-hydrolase [Longimicrobium terrae]|uniref:Zn-dependent M28 family amino/carboxypeptidase n=1 Tax=Longimicrobium terrae TaxID=1639882 RepID=A0A841H3Q5_9BACT|nr:Zn-dependent M28 family amino/carboxypeptidase [Longimicrobium terrae]MBB6072634.1 Zn-dependent M28 family amino/carboxypeptidase [Longimicrobium terrae]
MHRSAHPLLAALITLSAATSAAAQTPAAAALPPADNPRITQIVRDVSPARMEADVRRLVSFGTRHTLSDTVSRTRGIGAARRWIYDEFQRISRDCGGCLEVRYISEVIPGGNNPRIPTDTRVVDVVAFLRGQTDPNRHVLIMGHYDSRVTDVMNVTADAPGANDDASGTAAVIEAARVLSKHRFDGTIVFAALAGEEQGLNGGEILTRYAKANNWQIAAVLNNDIVGNSRGMNGATDNTVVRVFAPGIAPDAPAADLRRYLYSGGELDVAPRQLARYIDRMSDAYVPNLDVMIVYRLDRFGRGGDHTPFFLGGYPAVRLTELYEDYTRQHQDLRTENGIRYGDYPEDVDYVYNARITSLNAASLAALAGAPAAPDSVTVRGAVTPNTVLRWRAVNAADLAGYRVYWRLPADVNWTHSRFFPGNVTEATLENIVIDNWFFGVAAVDRDGNESLPVFPGPGR